MTVQNQETPTLPPSLKKKSESMHKAIVLHPQVE